MREETTFAAAFVFTVLLLNSHVHLSNAASGRKMLEVEEEKSMVVARRLNAANMKDYAPVQANPKHDPSRDPDLDPSTDPHDHDHDPDPPHEEADPPRQVLAPPPETDRSSIYHHVHHQHHPGSTRIQTPVSAPTATTIHDGV